jgi:ubiquinone biosynthesis protein
VLHNHTELGRRWQVKPLVETLTRTISNELDYQHEAHDSHVLAENLRRFDRLVVPQAIDDLTRARVLTMEHIDGVKITEASPVVLVELDRQELIRQLFRGYLHQVLVDGVFHSDPHPGNLLLTRDGRIALLDFGMITRISPETRMSMVKLLFAICHGEGEEAARIAEGMSEPTPLYKRQDFVHRISRLVAE